MNKTKEVKAGHKKFISINCCTYKPFILCIKKGCTVRCPEAVKNICRKPGF